MSTIPTRLRRPLSVPEVRLAPGGRTAVASLTAGTGAPVHDAPDGSLYLRADAATAAEVLYARVAGAWVAMGGT